jgi:hypothetical protein
MPEFYPRFIKPTSSQIHDVEQNHAEAAAMLEEVVQAVVSDARFVHESTGMTDASALFQYVFTFIHHQHRTQPLTIMNTTAVCAAAITRLARMVRGEEIDMTKFERVVSDDDNRDSKD